MESLTPSTSNEILGGFVIIRDGINYKLGAKPVKPGALIRFLDTVIQPDFENENPLIDNGDGTYRVSDNAQTGAHYFKMQAESSQYPYSIYVLAGEKDTATFRMVEGKLRVVQSIRPTKEFAINFRKGLSKAESFPEAVYISYQGQENVLAEHQEEGYWSGQANLGTKILFRVSGSPLSSGREVIGGEDGELDIDPDDL